MAKVTSPLHSERASGKLDGLVYYTWKGINVVRNWVVPSNPRTTPQQNVRNTFAGVAQMWGTLDAEQQQAWEDYALNSIFRTPNRDIPYPTGFSAFMSLNQESNVSGIGWILDPPTEKTMFQVSITSIIYNAGPPPRYEIFFSIYPELLGGEVAEMDVSPTLSNVGNHPKKSLYRVYTYQNLPSTSFIYETPGPTTTNAYWGRIRVIDGYGQTSWYTYFLMQP